MRYPHLGHFIAVAKPGPSVPGIVSLDGDNLVPSRLQWGQRVLAAQVRVRLITAASGKASSVHHPMVLESRLTVTANADNRPKQQAALRRWVMLAHGSRLYRVSTMPRARKSPHPIAITTISFSLIDFSIRGSELPRFSVVRK